MTAAPTLTEITKIATEAGTSDEVVVVAGAETKTTLLEPHDAARIFPQMTDEEFEALKADIQQHGIRQPILVHRGAILDGRHRHRACLELGIECPTVEWSGEGDVLALVVSLNLKRRHLTQSQVAAIAVEALPLYQKQAKERQRAAGGDKRAVTQEVEEAIPDRGEAAEHAARDFGVNRQYVYDAAFIKNAFPERFEKVKDGELSIAKAKAIRSTRATRCKRAKPPPSSSAGTQSAEVVRLQGANEKLKAELEKVRAANAELRTANAKLRADLRSETARYREAQDITFESNNQLRMENAQLRAELARETKPGASA